jgi:hypothetical protein
MKLSKHADMWLLQYFRLLRFYLSSASFNNPIVFDDAPPAATTTHSFLIFTAADSGYLNRFLRPFARSAVAHVRNPRLHIHLYNPQAADFEFLDAVRQELPGLTLTSSHETFAPESRELKSAASRQQSWKSLYICTSRFLAANAVQKKFSVSMLITDIDILFNGDIEGRLGRETDVALQLRPDERNMCKRTLGGVVYVSARTTGREFLSRVSSDISRFLAAGFYWFAFDQLALYRAVKSMPRDAFENRFSALSGSDISFDLGRGGLILFPKGKLKDQQEFADLAKGYTETR